VIRAGLGLAALAMAAEAFRAWRHDLRLNGRDRRRRAHWLLVLGGLGRMLGRAGGRLPAPPLAEPGARERAGLSGELSEADLAAARAGSTAAFAAVGALAVWASGAFPGALLASACAGFGWCAPDLWLRAAAARRAELIERQAPLALDLVAAAVSAGIPLAGALAAAQDAVSGPLREELRRVEANLALGRRRADELRELGVRSGSPSLSRLASALRISDRLGVPLADGLHRQAARARAERARRMQERAARAAPRILLVVVFLLVPAAMLPVMTALALSAVGSLGHLV